MRKAISPCLSGSIASRARAKQEAKLWLAGHLLGPRAAQGLQPYGNGKDAFVYHPRRRGDRIRASAHPVRLAGPYIELHVIAQVKPTKTLTGTPTDP
jgi:hypothetical protein